LSQESDKIVEIPALLDLIGIDEYGEFIAHLDDHERKGHLGQNGSEL
jgi:hypothetical protein